MSTVTKIVARPAEAPKTPVYPRLVHVTMSKDTVAWALRDGKVAGDFVGVIVSPGNSGWQVGEVGESFTKSLWNDFTGAVTLYNK